VTAAPPRRKATVRPSGAVASERHQSDERPGALRNDVDLAATGRRRSVAFRRARLLALVILGSFFQVARDGLVPLFRLCNAIAGWTTTTDAMIVWATDQSGNPNPSEAGATVVSADVQM